VCVRIRTLRGFALLALLALAGCVSLPKKVEKSASVAIPLSESTALGRLAAQATEGRNLSGFRLLSSGQEAFASLIALADHAERSIDIQQYIIEQDESSRALLRHVRAAAARGVRVRILLDDFNTVGMDRRMMRLDEQQNMQVRLFNPFPGGRLAYWTRFLSSAGEMSRINHRMHNKLFVADDALAVTGGRNIGDQYFVKDKENNFVDLDVLAAGPVVPQLSASFDAFWNSKYAYPIASLVSPVSGPPVHAPGPDLATPASANFLDQEINAGKLELSWVPAAVLADQPAKIAGESDPEQVEPISDSVAALMRTASEEVTVISAYFVPGKQGVSLVRDLVARGVHVRILTNSLATTDSPLVHIGYSRYRLDLLKAGVELYEMRAVLGQKKVRFHPFRSSRASLHAKSIVIDHKTVFIGSMNMDARSARTNSELGLVIRSAGMAHQVESLFDDVVADGSYALSLSEDRRHLRWSFGEGAARKTWSKDPDTSFMRRFSLKLLTPFAPDDLL
jgi:cardiolipin synthase C